MTCVPSLLCDKKYWYSTEYKSDCMEEKTRGDINIYFWDKKWLMIMNLIILTILQQLNASFLKKHVRNTF